MSNRLTFSLASLIVLIAFGFVFAPIFVMAHDPGAGQIPTQADGSSEPASHDHSNSDGSQDGIADDSNTTDDEEVPAHNSHPMVDSIALKSMDNRTRDNMVVVGVDDTDTTDVKENEFTLIVTFDQDVVSAVSIRDVTKDNDGATPPVDNIVLSSDANPPTAQTPSATPASLGEFTAGDFKARLLNGDSTAVSTETQVTIMNATRVADRSDQFEVVVSLADSDPSTDDVFPTGKMGATARELIIQVIRNAAYSLETTSGFDVIAGSGSSTSAVYSFTLVNALDAITLESAMAEEGATLDEPFDVTFTFSAPVTLVQDDITITGGGAVTDGPAKASNPSDGTVWTVEVEALASATSLTVTIDAGNLESGTEIEHQAATNSMPAYMAAVVAVPGKPMNVTATADNDANTITIDWTDVSGATSYIVKKSYEDPEDAEKTITKVVSEDDLSESKLTIPPAGADPLMQGVEFSFTVIAVNSVGQSEESDAGTAELMVDPTTPPVFDLSRGSAPDIDIWVGYNYRPEDANGDQIFLPRATDTLGDTITYELNEALPQGFDLRQNDAQDRWVEANPEDADGEPILSAKTADTDGWKSYEYYAVDQHGTRSKPVKFRIRVSDAIKPTAPENVMAMEEGFTANPLDRVTNTNKVVTSWDEPVDDSGKGSSHMPAIPFGAPITEYKVQWNVKDMPSEGDAHYLVTEADHEDEFEARESTTRGPGTTGGVLDISRYEFQVSAMNSAGYGPLSEKTDDSEVLVANPPSTPRDLGEGDEREKPTTITLNWLASDNTGLPVGETGPAYTPVPPGTEIADGAITYYLEQTFNNVKNEDPIATQGTDATEAPLTDTTHKLEDLKSGDYVFRVIAVNFDGASSPSLLSRHQVLVDPAADTTNRAPRFPADDDEIANIVATEDEAISGRFLPEAEDPDANDTLTYSILDKDDMETTSPGGLTFDPKTRALTGTPADDMPETAYTYVVKDKAGASDSIGFFITVEAAEPTPVDPGLPTVSMIPSKGYAVFVPMNHDASALPTGLATATVAGMPDLNAFFVTGGTIDVVVAGKAKHNVIITEIMVAKDLGRVGQTGTSRPEASQWIELYNNTDDAISVSDITFTFVTGFPAAAAPANGTDRFSNVVSPGWNIATTFADALSGETAVNASGVTTVTKMFKSLRRKHKDDKKLQDAGTVIQDGWNSGSWALTAGSRVFLAGRIGTPGSQNRPTVFAPAVFTAPTMSVTFNEVANRNDDSNEWIELKGPADTNLKLHKISIVTGYDKAANTGTETEIYKFPDADVKIPAGDLLLLTDQDPVSNEIAADLEKGVPKPVRYRIVTLGGLPNSGDFLLVLRNKDGKILDVAGHLAGLDDDDPYTLMWPLAAAVGAPGGKKGHISAKNKLAGGNVYKRARAIQGYLSNKDNGDEPAFEGAGFSGIGYDRLVTATNKEHHGTPGYANNAQIGAGTAATDNVIISEIMVGDGGDRFPQWIEIHNQSATNGVDLHNWRLYIINHSQNADDSSFAGKLLDEVWLRNVKIPPKQTALIVTRSAPRHTTNLPNHRILNLRYDRPLLSSKGFSLRLEANSHEGDVNKRQAGDAIGNLAAPEMGNRRADHQAFLEPAWALPAGMDQEGSRVSIARVPPADNGMEVYGWVSSMEDARAYGVATYYGRSNDVGSPGHTAGGVLPVSLSKFRPERLDDGSIRIVWITESELNNAGFNILRGEKRDGEFTQINTKLIAGQGTTSERTTYTHVDTSVKPNVVYYYQIQDVSLDGKVQALRLSRLKGDISAAGKLTTTWGELKALQ